MNRRHTALTTLKHWALAVRGRERQSGQSMVILAIGLVALLGFAGLVFDGGTAYAQYRRMQNAADAGALAGATELSRRKDSVNPATNASVCAAVKNYAETLNGLPVYGGQTPPKVKIQYLRYNEGAKETQTMDPPLQDPDQSITCEGNTSAPPAPARGVRVTNSTTFNTWFLGLFGQRIGTSTAHSSAEYGNVLPQRAQPIAKRCDDPNDDYCGFAVTDPPTIVDIWQSDQSGNYGWLTWAGDNDARILAEELAINYNYIGNYIDDVSVPPCEQLNKGCWVQGAPGIKTSGNPRKDEEDQAGVRTALDEWIASGKPMIIVIYDEQAEKSGSRSDYRVAGFAAFFPDSYQLSQKHLWGHYGYWVMAGQLCNECEDMGLYTVRLIPDAVEPPPPPPADGTVFVHVLNDVNRDCAPEPWDPDFYVGGAQVTVRDSGGTVRGGWTTYGISANSIKLPQGDYSVSEINPSSPLLPLSCGSDTQNFHINSNEVKDIWFLDYTTSAGNLIVNVVDGDNGNAPFAGANVAVRDAGNNTAGSGTTPISGTLTFKQLPAGLYTVSATYPNKSADPQSISVVENMTKSVTLTMRQVVAGNLSIRVIDDALAGISGVQVNINGPGISNTIYTDGSGYVTMNQVPLGTYTVTEVNKPPYESLSPDTVSTTIATNGETKNVQFQDRLPQRGTICVLVFDDVTGDGNWSPAEMLVSGALVQIFSGANEIGRWTTNGSEPHCYSNLQLGPYTVVETNPAGYTSTNGDSRSVTVQNNTSVDAYFGDRMATPTPSFTPSRTVKPSNTPVTPTATWTLTPTPGPSPTPTITPIPGALCVTVYQDSNSNGNFDSTPPAPPPAPTPTVAFTPEVLLVPQSVTVQNASGTTVGTWDGSGAQPHCFDPIYPGSYTALEKDPSGYGSTTANSVTSPVQSSVSTSVFFGDLLCLPRAPRMADVTYEGGKYYLHWENVGALSYEIYGSFTCATIGCPTPAPPTPAPWHLVNIVSVVNYEVVQQTDGNFFYVVARNNCGASLPSNIVPLK